MTDIPFESPSWLARGGEMGERMRAHAWSATPLGPIAQWPQSLQTSVSTSLSCAFPIVLWWGPDLVILYNDEYAQILGPAKHPAALGVPGAVVWSEIWDVIGPMLSHVVESGEATRSRDLLLHVDRGYLEEAYFSFSYSPIYREDGRVGGVFCPVIETTEKVIGERRLRTLRDLADRCKGAKDEDTALAGTMLALEQNPQDVPFALIYRVDHANERAELAASIGIEPDGPSAPRRVDLSDGRGGAWSLGSVARSGRAEVITDLASRFDALPTGAWTSSPHTAMVLPVLLPGQSRPRAIIVAGVSPMRALDEDHRTFFGLLATQVASGLADAGAREEERRRVEALAEIDRAKTAFFSNVSHEFRTPLTLILGPVEDMLKNSAQRPEDREQIELVHRNSLRLLKLVNTLLDFTRIEANRVQASFEPTDLATLTTHLASSFRSAIERAGMTLDVDCQRLREPVFVDHDMWEKIVLNLLSNAFKYTFHGGIGVTLATEGDAAVLTVADTGVGIPDKDLPRVFERFHRVEGVHGRTHEGSGIGLALVKELARLHGGDVSVRSVLGAGTTFRVSLPMGKAHLSEERIGTARQLASTATGVSPYLEEALRWLPGAASVPSGASVPPDAAPPANRPRSATTRRGRKARILLADDNADMRDYLGRVLLGQYDVEAVADGMEALSAARRRAPDLILSDVMMPRMDGFELLREIRRDSLLRATPFLLLSARAGEEARVEGWNAGADDYLVKPFSAKELVARVATHLKMARVRREADRKKDEFLAVLAHELRNPLAPIRTGLELLRLGEGSPESIEQVRTIMERQIGHMVHLVDDLLDVSRITSGKIQLQRQLTPLTELVESAVEETRAYMTERGVALAVDLPTTACVLDVDRTRFVQILSNVLHNAAKFTEAGGHIELRAVVPSNQTQAPELVLTISDDGVGISPTMLPRVFDLFAQDKRSSEAGRGGLGIGLALVRRLIEMHDGSVEARSDGPGRGTEITIRLPVSSEASADTPAFVTTPSAVNCRVLVVDDNEDAARTLAMLVNTLGGESRLANDGASGLKALAEFRPEIVMLDISMSGLDGYETCRLMRRSSTRPDLVIVALTGWGQEADKQRAREAGFDVHLTKPADPVALSRLFARIQPGDRRIRDVQ